MPRVREYCAKFERGVVPRGPRKFVRNMRVGIKKCAEIVQNLCGTILAQNWGEFPRICLHKFCAFFRQDLNFLLIPSCAGKSTLNTSFVSEGRVFLCLSSLRWIVMVLQSPHYQTTACQSRARLRALTLRKGRSCTKNTMALESVELFGYSLLH